MDEMKTIRLLSWNVNGLRAVHKKGFLDWFTRESPDVLCIQETKAHKEQLPEDLLRVEGYHAHFASAERKGYSGVALYTKMEPQSINTTLNADRFDREGRTIVADYGDFVLLNVYFPNGKASQERLRYKMDFYTHFLEYIEDLHQNGRPLVICGDVNTAHKPIDLARAKENETVSGFLPEERAWIDALLDKGFVDTFRLIHQEGNQYTWWHYVTRARERNVGWRIDYFFVSEDLKPQIQDAFILNDVMGSDHCPVGLELTVNP